jgi:hypothetical protein
VREVQASRTMYLPGDALKHPVAEQPDLQPAHGGELPLAHRSVQQREQLRQATYHVRHNHVSGQLVAAFVERELSNHFPYCTSVCPAQPGLVLLALEEAHRPMDVSRRGKNRPVRRM